jgi:hypothetical protein
MANRIGVLRNGGWRGEISSHGYQLSSEERVLPLRREVSWAEGACQSKRRHLCRRKPSHLRGLGVQGLSGVPHIKVPYPRYLLIVASEGLDQHLNSDTLGMNIRNGRVGIYLSQKNLNMYCFP